jgi:hypothetical protein
MKIDFAALSCDVCWLYFHQRRDISFDPQGSTQPVATIRSLVGCDSSSKRSKCEASPLQCRSVVGGPFVLVGVWGVVTKSSTKG